mgnify:CR=1 FL=1
MYDFRTVRFSSGAHDTREQGMCVMEAVAYIACEQHSDRPKCACPAASLKLVPELVQYAQQLEGLPEITAGTVADAIPTLQAAWSAAWSAARSAAWLAAWLAAVHRQLQPLIESAQHSATNLLERMIALTEPREIVFDGMDKRAKELIEW